MVSVLLPISISGCVIPEVGLAGVLKHFRSASWAYFGSLGSVFFPLAVCIYIYIHRQVSIRYGKPGSPVFAILGLR